MEIKILASTHPGFSLSKNEALEFSGKSAGICYEKTTLEDVFNEPSEKSINRAKGCIKRGHHSVLGHVFYSLALTGIPKILAMFLNNEKVYVTSEKSARYTHMKPSPAEEALYEKWIGIFTKIILETYNEFDEDSALKLAQENARYMISIFTPATDMEYTASLRQWNYIIHWAEKYIKEEEDNYFSIKMKTVLKEFLSKMPDIKIEGLNTEVNNRGFSLIGKRKRKESFGEVYCTNYEATFSCLAQEHRHKTLSYECLIPEEYLASGFKYEFGVPKDQKFYVPTIIKNTVYEEEWLRDINSLAEYVPQGTLININERGTYEMFILKCYERLCGHVQLETAIQTDVTLKKFMESVKETDPEVYEEMLPYSHGARCTFPGFKCQKPCVFGPKNALNRRI